MPTLISYSLRVEQELTPNTSLTVGYVGSHGYHQIVGLDANTPVPTICPIAPCPATYPSNFPAAIGGYAGPGGIVLHSHWKTEGEPFPSQYMDLVFRWRQQLQRAAGRSKSSLQP